MTRRVIFAVLLSFLSLAASAAERTFVFRPDATTIRWTLVATGHTVEGTFDLTSGRVVWDPDSESVSGSIEIDARSARSGNDRRDRKMHDDVLESARFPTIVLEPAKIVGQVVEGATSRVTLHGTIRIHGSVHPIVIPADVRLDDGALSVRASFRVPFVDWGLKDPSVFLVRVAKHVDVSLDARASIEDPGR